MKRSIYGILAVSAWVACVCLAAPEPAVVSPPGQWTIDTEFTHPQQITLTRASDNKTLRFLYTIVTLTNNTGEDVGFYPKCDMMTDTFRIIPAGQAVPPAVIEQIKIRYKDRYPFLESLNEAGDKILQGEDNTKDIVIVWPDFDIKARNIKLFIAGLSNETVAINHPVEKDVNGRPVKVFLRKTLELSYVLKGDPALNSDIGLTYISKRWIMR